MPKSYDGGPVGYKKPPAEHQFKPGGKKPKRSGRKKGVKNSRDIIEELFSEKVTMSLDGKTKVMTKKEVLIRLGYHKATKASSINEMNALLRFYQKLAPDCVDPPLPLQVESIPGDEGL